MNWEAAIARSFLAEGTGVIPPEDHDVPNLEPPPPATVPLIVVDHFDLTMIEMPLCGACLLVRQIHKPDALALVRKYNPPTYAMNERGQGALERELQIDPLPRARCRYGTRLLVMLSPRWNDIRWFLVEWQADGEGVVP